MRVPGFTSSLDAGVGPQVSLAMLISSRAFFLLTLLQLRENS
jgi:hypothetical protein